MNVSGLTVYKTLDTVDQITYCMVSPDGKFIIYSLLDNSIRIFFEDTNKFYLSLYGHKVSIKDLINFNKNSYQYYHSMYQVTTHYLFQDQETKTLKYGEWISEIVINQYLLMVTLLLVLNLLKRLIISFHLLKINVLGIGTQTQ